MEPPITFREQTYVANWTRCTFGPVYPEASSLSGNFLKEAQMLIPGERNNPSALNVASLMILSIGGICFGIDKLARTYLADGIQMAENLGLMGTQRRTAEQLKATLPDPPSMLEHVAWGSFNFTW